MNLTWRPLTLDDMPALAELYAAAEVVDPTGEHDSADDLRELMTRPTVDLAAGSTSAWDGERMVAYAAANVRDSANEVHQLQVDVLVHPERRTDEMGAYLTGWLRRTAIALHKTAFPAADLELHAPVFESQHWQASVLEGAGYRRARTFVDMQVRLDTVPEAPGIPAELRLVPYEDRHSEPARLTRNDTFAEHFGMTPASPEAWHHSVTGSTFRPELSYLLLAPDSDEVVAMVMSHYYASATAATGVRECYILTAGTRRAWRGRGLASALIARVMAEAKVRGYQRAALSVDVDNVTKALGVYERLGFRTVRTSYAYVLPVGSC